MTFVWFLSWFVADHTGGRAPLLLHPANVWTWTLLLAVALDLGSHHARGGAKR